MSTSLVSPDSDDVEVAARSLEGRSPEDILLYAADRYFPRIGFSTGFGPEGCVLLDLIGELISQRLPLADGVEAYRMFAERRAGCTKVVLIPG